MVKTWLQLWVIFDPQVQTTKQGSMCKRTDHEKLIITMKSFCCICFVGL